MCCSACNLNKRCLCEENQCQTFTAYPKVKYQFLFLCVFIICLIILMERDYFGKIVMVEQIKIRKRIISNYSFFTCPTMSQFEGVMRNTTESSFHFVGEKDAAVFSAYLDRRRGIKVRLIGAVIPARIKKYKFYCQLVDLQDFNITEVDAHFDPMIFGFNLKYETTLIDCPLERIPSSNTVVGLVRGQRESRRCSVSTFYKKIDHIPTEVKTSGLEMCLGPQYGNYSKVNYLIEFLELNQILGYNHFVFYNYSWSPEVSKVIRHYEERGIVTVVPWHGLIFETGNAWPIPKGVKYYIHYFAQIMAFHDCIYRRMNRKNAYITIQDIDEITVPYSSKSLPQIVKRLMPPNGDIASLMIRSTFFPLNLPDVAHDKSDDNLIFMTKRKHLNIFKYGDRSKMIYFGYKTVKVSVHWAARTYGRGKNVMLTDILLHHYRRWTKKNEKAVISNRTVTFAKELRFRINDRKKKLSL